MPNVALKQPSTTRFEAILNCNELGGNQNRVLTISAAPLEGKVGDAHIDLRRYSHNDLFHSDCPQACFQTINFTLPHASLHNLRPLLRDCDWLLKVGGTLIITADRSDLDCVQLEVFRILSLRYDLSTTDRIISARKHTARSPETTDNTYWSIAVISGGNNEKRLAEIFDSIEKNNIPDLDLMIIGPEPKLKLPSYARHIAFEEHPVDPRFPITQKKNLAADHARHENMLVTHDRFFLSPDWYQGVLQARGDWDVFCFPVQIMDQPGVRMADWLVFEESPGQTSNTTRATQYFKTYPFDYTYFRHQILPYSAYSPTLMANGGAFASKRSVLRSTPIASYLYWSEVEDAEWSQRVINAGGIISFAQAAALCTRVDQAHQGLRFSSSWFDTQHLRLRHAVRNIGFSFLQSLLDRLNNRYDFYSKRGIFSRTIKTVRPENLHELSTLDFGALEGIYLQGFFEKARDIREILTVIKANVPSGKRVYLELSTTGFQYFRRSEHLRNCESLRLDVSVVFQHEFILKNLICTAQSNFILEYERVSGPIKFGFANSAVWVRKDLNTSQICTLIEQQFGCKAVPLPQSATQSEIAKFDAIFVINSADAIKTLHLHQKTFIQRGNIVAPTPSGLMLESDLIMSGTTFAQALGTFPLQEDRSLAEVFELNLCMIGFRPNPIGIASK